MRPEQITTFSLVFLSVISILSSKTYGDSDLKDLVDFLQANNSWRSYDILVEENLFTDDESLTEITRTHRMKVDLDRERVVTVTSMRRTVVGRNEVPTKTTLFVKSIDKNTSFERCDDKVAPFRSDTFLDAVAASQIPLLEQIGLKTYPNYPNPSDGGKQFEASWRIHRVGFKDLATARRLSTKTDVVVIRRTPNKQFSLAYKWSFANDTLLPISVSRTHIVRAGTPNEGRCIAERTKFEWKDYKGLSLPVLVDIESISRTGNPNFNTVKISWLSVNEDIEFPTAPAGSRSKEYWYEQLRVDPDEFIVQADPLEKTAQ
ncbi:MAG TPA: hypothetical protein DDW52_16975 [Planctomycetaceae bacterium]|nr:hypothetical protein [Planctomycetaceae bacterium]